MVRSSDEPAAEKTVIIAASRVTLVSRSQNERDEEEEAAHISQP
jgi:hypothetical protein